jgi:hypothetical protein
MSFGPIDIATSPIHLDAFKIMLICLSVFCLTSFSFVPGYLIRDTIRQQWRRTEYYLHRKIQIAHHVPSQFNVSLIALRLHI